MFAQVLLFIQTKLCLYTHSMWKWLLHVITGKCELLRIQYDQPSGAQRTLLSELSLQHSKYPELQAVVRPSDLSLQDIVSEVMRVKGINDEKHPMFRPQFLQVVEKIRGYQALLHDIQVLRGQVYSETEHVPQLMKLWSNLKPDEALEKRFTRQWGDIGFQGENPATDFRGMGLLGLENLVFFSTQYPSLARQVLLHSNNPSFGYSFAIVGINLTELCMRFMMAGLLKPHFYNLPTSSPKVESFHQVYCYIFYEFDKLWMSEKPGIMQFNKIREHFEAELKRKLSDPTVLLRLTFLS